MQAKFSRLAVLLLVCVIGFGSINSLAGSGQIQFKRPKDADPLLENPQTFGKSREEMMDLIKQTLKDMEIPLDEKRTTEQTGMLYTKPVIFTKGGPSGENLEFVSRRPGGQLRNWTRGRYTLQIEVAPVDPQRIKLFVFAQIEGEYQDDALGAKWVACPSRGVIESNTLQAFKDRMGEQP